MLKFLKILTNGLVATVIFVITLVLGAIAALINIFVQKQMPNVEELEAMSTSESATKEQVRSTANTPVRMAHVQSK